MERTPAPVCFKSLVISSSNAGLCVKICKDSEGMKDSDARKCIYTHLTLHVGEDNLIQINKISDLDST